MNLISRFKTAGLLLFKRRDHMIFVTVYVGLIVGGRRTFDSVPDHLKDDVKADLEAMGLDEDGIPLSA